MFRGAKSCQKMPAASIGMDAAVRPEIADEFGPLLSSLQYRGQGYKDGRVFDAYGIFLVPNPYAPAAHKKRR